MLRLEGVSAAYGPVVALRDVTVEVGMGELVALVGSNGAGKSTILKAISGLVPCAAGRILFEGRDLAGLDPERIVELGVTHVPEGRRIFPRLSVEQNLDMGAYTGRAHGRRAETRDRVYALFPRLRERRRQPGGALSGGEQQILAFGRAMMAHPKLLMLDEPSLGLAPIMVDEIMRAIAHFRATGVTILLVEQNAELALRVATRGYVLETGRIVLDGDGAALLADPQVWASYLGAEQPEEAGAVLMPS